MTPRYFHALGERCRKREKATDEHRDFMLAQIVEMVANCGQLQWSRPRHWREFMPRYERPATRKRKRTTAQERRQFDESMARAMRAAVAHQNSKSH